MVPRFDEVTSVTKTVHSTCAVTKQAEFGVWRCGLRPPKGSLDEGGQANVDSACAIPRRAHARWREPGLSRSRGSGSTRRIRPRKAELADGLRLFRGLQGLATTTPQLPGHKPPHGGSHTPPVQTEISISCRLGRRASTATARLWAAVTRTQGLAQATSSFTLRRPDSASAEADNAGPPAIRSSRGAANAEPST